MSDARDPAPCAGAAERDLVQLDRRQTIRLAGGWIVYVGALSSAACLSAFVGACGRTPLGDPFGDGGPTPTPDGTPTGSGTPTPTPTATADPCDCTQVGGVNLGIKTTQIPTNSLAYNTAYGLFVCHEGGTTLPGFYILTSICSHSGCDIGVAVGSTFSTSNLGAGFHCGCHGSGFNANGSVKNGPAALPLNHFPMAVDAGTKDIYLLGKNPPFPDINCRCPG